MTNKETVNRNVGLSFDFIRQVVNHPEMIDNIDDDSTISYDTAVAKDVAAASIIGTLSTVA